jgi:hypothetical protein
MYAWKYPALLLVAHLLCYIGLPAQQKSQKPTAVFSAVFWERFMSARVSYAPWGNENDDNATFREVQVDFSAPSQKFVYYGTENLKFYDPSETSTSVLADAVTTEEPIKRTPIAEFPFSSDGEEETKQYLLLFLKDPKDTDLKYKIHALPFSTTDVPQGSLKCFSQLRETVYFTFGKSKASLASGKSTLIQGQIGSASEFRPLAAYFLSAGKYEKVMSQSLSFSNRQRGVLFFTKQRGRLRSKIYLENLQSLERAIGYGVKPLINEIPAENERQGLEEQNPINPVVRPEA